MTRPISTLEEMECVATTRFSCELELFVCLMSSGELLLAVPQTRLKNQGDQSSQAAAPWLWNALLISWCCVNSIDKVKKHLETVTSS